ncbi:MAG TPA: hypothetical protein VG819_07410 [Rhizomicrobium sp.]|nr:hypothetical protein [Rhizomicrobium sp.]
MRRTSSAMLARGGSSCVIGLDVVKRVAGARWEKMREAVHQRMEMLLRQKLGPSDFFIRVDDVSYLVTIPSTDAEEVQVCCLRVAFELHTGLLGPCTIGQLQIASATARDDETLVVTPIVVPQIFALAERAGIDELVRAGAPAVDREGGRFAGGQGRYYRVRHFVPIWDARAEAVSAYRCVVEALEPVSQAPTPKAKAHAALSIALGTLDCAVQALETHIARGERFLVHVQIPFETLSSPVARMEFVAACRALSHELRPYLVFEIGDLPVGVPQSRLNDLVTTIRPFARGIAAEVALRNPTLVMYQGIGLYAIGLNLSGPPDSLTRVEIERLAINARRFGISAFLSEVSNTPLIEFARECGVQWMSGPAILKSVEQPGPMIRLHASEVLRRGARASA